MRESDTESDSGSDSGLAFAKIDMSDVDFDTNNANEKDEDQQAIMMELVKAIDEGICFGDYSVLVESKDVVIPENLRALGRLMSEGNYADALRSDSGRNVFEHAQSLVSSHSTVAKIIQESVMVQTKCIFSFVEAELLGVAALNLFLQANYTGPALSETHHVAALADVNPHRFFQKRLNALDTATKEKSKEVSTLETKSKNSSYQNSVLSELAVEGDWPCEVCLHPYFLLLARSILLPLADPKRPDWTHSYTGDSPVVDNKGSFDVCQLSPMFRSASVWSARAAVAHERLLQSRAPCETLFREVDALYKRAIQSLIKENSGDQVAAILWLEHGLAEHHFDRPGKGKAAFVTAKEFSGLQVEVTGAIGKRTKFQQSATAQYLVNATSTAADGKQLVELHDDPNLVKKQMIGHSDEEILLERIKFNDDKENEISELHVLDQTILLALCLDVKNTNPNDGLTAEEMGAYLARVLDHHNNWMVYSTGLLERAWLEFERSHARERAILQLQALVDQHTERLTITQSTRESIEQSAPVQDRLKMIHCLVYPPRWIMIQDLADRYAALGIVTSAAELFTDIEMWDDVVDCYRRAGKTNLAEKVVRERLEMQETPRMWAALGDLTNDAKHYLKSIELSNGRYYEAYNSLAAYYFEKKDLPAALENYEQALKLRPLQPFVWFRLGAISMQLERWDLALKAFSEVVQQEPEEAEAWANVAAIHLHNKHPTEAYPALVEALRYNRNNWRVWVSKLYTCLDLKKFDEAIQACNILLDLRTSRKSSDSAPCVEPKCVRAIVGGVLAQFRENKDDNVALESSNRSLSRTYELLRRISASSETEDAWIFETLAYFHEQIGQDNMVLEYLMKEYRSLSSIQGWEKDNFHLRKVCGAVSHILHIYTMMDDKESLTKAKFLARGVVKKIRTTRPDDPAVPAEVAALEKSLDEVSERLSNIQ
jgi:tetratricopeptide (TPR) repeat protein